MGKSIYTCLARWFTTSPWRGVVLLYGPLVTVILVCLAIWGPDGGAASRAAALHSFDDRCRHRLMAARFTSEDKTDTQRPDASHSVHLLAAPLANDDGDADTPPLLYWAVLRWPSCAANGQPLSGQQLQDVVQHSFDAEMNALGPQRPRSAESKLPQDLIQAVIRDVDQQVAPGTVIYLDTY